MSIYSYEEAFGQADMTTKAMRDALEQWRALYYQQTATAQSDPCQRIAYTIVSKLVKTMFGEYNIFSEDAVTTKLLQALNAVAREAIQITLVEGECYLKPCMDSDGIHFVTVARSNMLIFARDATGKPVDVGTAERSVADESYFTLLERRQVDGDGYLTITNRLYRSADASRLGTQVPLQTCARYGDLEESYRFPQPVGSVGLVRLKTPILNCVDGSPDGVCVYAPAVGLIANIDANEAQLNQEFSNGLSRVIASADMLKKDAFGGRALQDSLFVGLDDDPETVGITVFSPELRQKSFLERKQEYLRNVESIIGLRRGMLSDANVEERTATEIISSTGDFSLTVIDFQNMWQNAVQEAVELSSILAGLYGLPAPQDRSVHVDWGNGVLFDEGQTWQEYVQMVNMGLIRPEIALGWRFDLPVDTPEDLEKIRTRWMPEKVATP